MSLERGSEVWISAADHINAIRERKFSSGLYVHTSDASHDILYYASI